MYDVLLSTIDALNYVQTREAGDSISTPSLLHDVGNSTYPA
jgi:hypothetical protein